MVSTELIPIIFSNFLRFLSIPISLALSNNCMSIPASGIIGNFFCSKNLFTEFSINCDEKTSGDNDKEILFSACFNKISQY